MAWAELGACARAAAAVRGGTYLVENVLQLVLCQGAALHILDGAEFLCHPLAVLLPYRRHLLLGQLVAHARVVPQIYLGADYEAGHTGAVVVDLREPLLPYVLERGRRCDAEAD